MIRSTYRLVLPALLAFLVLCPWSSAEPREIKRVLVLFSEYESNPNLDVAEQGIQEVFRANNLFDVELYSEYLDLSRFPNPSYARLVAEFLRRKYSATKIDLLITVYPSALDFLLEWRSTLFPAVPFIAAAITASQAHYLTRSVHHPVTGTIVHEDLLDLTDTALRSRPRTKHFAVVSGTARSDRITETAYRSIRGHPEIDVIDLTRLSMEETLTRVSSLPPETLVLYFSIFRDKTGQVFVPRDALSLISKASNAPVFGFYETYLGFGIVGGRLVSFVKHGREAATLALRILKGESPASIPFGGRDAYVSAYDWRELNRWAIDEKQLPPGSAVRHKPRSLWEEHRRTVLGSLFFAAIETALVIALLVNLARRRRAEAATAASELRYRTVADYTHDWEYWSAPDGTLKYVSPSCERITGYSAREFMDDPSLFFRIMLAEDRKHWAQHQENSRTQAGPRQVQFRIVRKDSEIRWIDHVSLPVDNDQGAFGIRASNRDVTDQIQAESDAQQRWNELAHVTRVATMGELTSSLAHEINQPLAAIRNYANAAQRFLSLDQPNVPKAQDALQGIIRDDRRAADVISAIRGLLKRTEPRYLPLQVNDLVRESLAFIRTDPGFKGLAVETKLGSNVPQVLGDRVQLQQVLLNLVLNARDAMDEAGSRRLVIKTGHDNGMVQVSVRDNGRGIADSHLEKLFEPFQTTKPGGMGMGLAISARIIQAHEGLIGGENNPDGGATFWFTLPSQLQKAEGIRTTGN
jgi:PAS domain S-box-containing protein